MDHSHPDMAPDFALSAERHINARVLFGEWEELLTFDGARHPTHMSLHQVAQILQYKDLEVLAEHAITTALDGIPGAYVRR